MSVPSSFQARRSNDGGDWPFSHPLTTYWKTRSLALSREKVRFMSRELSERAGAQVAAEHVDRRLVGEGPEGARPGEVGVGVDEGRRVHAVATVGRIERHRHGAEGAAQAHRERVDALGAGDGPDDLDGPERSLVEVLVEGGVARRRSGLR